MNIYVGNLSYKVTEEELKAAFEAFGHVESVKVIKDMYTGRSRGFAFVEMSNKSEAFDAIDGMNGKEIKGRSIKVNKARSGGQGQGQGQGRQRRGRNQGGAWRNY